MESGREGERGSGGEGEWGRERESTMHPELYANWTKQTKAVPNPVRRLPADGMSHEAFLLGICLRGLK